jgi:hypothetical protein
MVRYLRLAPGHMVIERTKYVFFHVANIVIDPLVPHIYVCLSLFFAGKQSL